MELHTNSSCSALLQSANPATTNWTASTLTDGTYYWRVRGKDSSGTTSSWSTCRSVRIDTVAPTTSFSANTATCSAGNVTVTLTCTDGSGAGCASIQYKVVDQAASCDTSGLSTYTTPFAISGA